MQQQLIAHQLSDLEQILAQLLPLIQKRKKVAFVGAIGAGKTTFIKLLCQRLGVEDQTSSPTFSIINEYKAPSQSIYHVDLYRLETEEDAFNIGIMELLEDDSYCFIEWPDLIETYFPESTLWIRITAEESGKRVFDLYYE